MVLGELKIECQSRFTEKGTKKGFFSDLKLRHQKELHQNYCIQKHICSTQINLKSISVLLAKNHNLMSQQRIN
jgi:hypothetical protein